MSKIFAAQEGHVNLIIQMADNDQLCKDAAAKELLEIGMAAFRLAHKAIKKAKAYRTRTE